MPSEKSVHGVQLTLYASVFLFSYELAATNSFGLLEFFLLTLSCCLVLNMWKGFGGQPIAAAHFFLLYGQAGASLALALLGCLLADMVTLLYAPVAGIMWEKYRLIVAIFPVLLAILSLRSHAGALRYVRLAVALSSTVICVVTLVNTFLVPIYPRYYALRLTLRRDYNMFSTAILVGMLSGAFDALEHGRTLGRRTAGMLFFLLPALPVIILSASRRILLVLPLFLTALFAAWFMREQGVKARLASLLTAVGAAVAVAGFSMLFSWGLSHSNRVVPQQSHSAGETTVSDRYETIATGTMLFSRRVLWQLACLELADYNAIEWLFGRGAGHSIIFYDALQEPLDSIYSDPALRLGKLSPHNLFLTDLLDGGIVRLVADLTFLLVTFLLTVRLIRLRPYTGLPIALILGLCLMNSMISNRFGLLYDRYDYIFTALLAVESGASDGEDIHENCHGDSPTPT